MSEHCCGKDKMCAITCCPCDLDIEKIKPLVDKAEFICEACGRVANKEENLCKPKALR